MTFELLSKIISNNNIPHNVILESDSGWECDPTDMDGVWYNSKKNRIIFTQKGDRFDSQFRDPDWKCVHSVCEHYLTQCQHCQYRIPPYSLIKCVDCGLFGDGSNFEPIKETED